EPSQLATVRQVENAYVAVGWRVARPFAEETANSKQRAVGGHVDRVDLALVAVADLGADDASADTCLPVPHADCLVLGRRQQILAVRREGEVADDRAVAARVEVEIELDDILRRLRCWCLWRSRLRRCRSVFSGNGRRSRCRGRRLLRNGWVVPGGAH